MNSSHAEHPSRSCHGDARIETLAGILLAVLPSVVFGGVSILSLLVGDSAYMQNELRQDLWRGGDAHAGVLLILSLLALPYVDEASLSDGLKRVVRSSIPLSAILLPAAFFLSVLSPDAREPNGLIHLACAGAVVLTIGLLVLGVGLLRKRSDETTTAGVSRRA